MVWEVRELDESLVPDEGGWELRAEAVDRERASETPFHEMLTMMWGGSGSIELLKIWGSDHHGKDVNKSFPFFFLKWHFA